MENEITQTWYFSQSPQEVWQYLTKPELLEQWLGKADFKPVAGHRFTLAGHEDCLTYCEVLEANPFTHLSYSWQTNSVTGNKPFNSKVVWSLTTKENGTELQLLHNGITAIQDYTAHHDGWKILVNRMTSLLNAKKETSSSFTKSIAAKISAAEASQKIGRVTEWWGVNLTGSAEKKNDAFVIKMGGDSFFNFTVTELLPGKKVVWLVTDCNMPWYANKKEWANTQLIFDLAENNGTTTLNFTHEGLTPQVDCYKDCEKGWTHWITTSLLSYFTTGKGNFVQPK